MWNMAAAFASSRHEDGWRHLAERDDFDVALLQEAQAPPTWAHDHWPSQVWSPKYAQKRRDPWGCAVIACGLELQAYEPDGYPWLASLAGSTAIARTSTEPHWLVSVHLTARRVPAGLLTTHPLDGIEITTADKSVWETNVIPHELHRLFGGETFLWGGDLNCDPKMDGRRGFAGGNQRVFDIYREAGSVDVRARFHATYQQTFFRPGTDNYQLDHVFADPATEQRVTTWAVDPTPATGPEPLSDHAPILLNLGPMEAAAPARQRVVEKAGERPSQAY